MKPITFSESNKVMGENQAPLLPLPVHARMENVGRVTSCWQLTVKERFKLLFTGKIWCQQLTFRNPLQPQKLLVDKPNLEPVKEVKNIYCSKCGGIDIYKDLTCLKCGYNPILE